MEFWRVLNLVDWMEDLMVLNKAAELVGKMEEIVVEVLAVRLVFLMAV